MMCNREECNLAKPLFIPPYLVAYFLLTSLGNVEALKTQEHKTKPNQNQTKTTKRQVK
jgi:hypothetical protein